MKFLGGDYQGLSQFFLNQTMSTTKLLSCCGFISLLNTFQTVLGFADRHTALAWG